jgi:putative endonuclease
MKTSLNKPTHLTLGELGESYAAAYLQQQGFRLVAANFTVPVGRNRRDAIINAELDLVAYDGPILCFIEVKTRASDWFAPPEVNVNRRKRRQIARAAREYRHMFALEGELYRYDVVTVIIGELPTPQIEILKNFWRDDGLKKRRWEPRFYQ